MTALLELGVDVFPLRGDGLMIVPDDWRTVRVAQMPHIATLYEDVAPAIGGQCSHVSRQLAGKYERDGRWYMVTWRVAICEHDAAGPVVITTAAREREL